jgi:hypothetical protein
LAGRWAEAQLYPKGKGNVKSKREREGERNSNSNSNSEYGVFFAALRMTSN